LTPVWNVSNCDGKSDFRNLNVIPLNGWRGVFRDATAFAVVPIDSEVIEPAMDAGWIL
jgi:hypothetical protein